MNIEWLAGVYEGEGTADKSKKTLVIGNTNKELLKDCLLVAGSGKIYGPYHYTNRPNTKQFYQWRTNSHDSEKIAETIHPYLSLRRRQQLENVFPGIWPESAKSMSISFAGGLFNGEGCFTTTNGTDLQSAIKMTDEDVIHRFQGLVNCGRIHVYSNVCPSHRNYKRTLPLYHWRGCIKASLYVGELLWPYLSNEKKQAFSRRLIQTIQNNGYHRSFCEQTADRLGIPKHEQTLTKRDRTE